MTLVETTDALSSTSAPLRTEHPRLTEVATRTVMSLLVAVVVPAVIFWAALLVFDIRVAVIVALVAMGIAMGWRVVNGRTVSQLLVLTMAVMTLKTVFTLVTGNTFVYFVQPVFADAVVALVFLGSLFTARPFVARLAPEFYPMDNALAARPGIRRLFRRLTLVWGVVIIAKGGATLFLLISLSMVDFVLVKSAAILTLTLAGVVATVALSVAVGRQEGLIKGFA